MPAINNMKDGQKNHALFVADAQVHGKITSKECAVYLEFCICIKAKIKTF